MIIVALRFAKPFSFGKSSFWRAKTAFFFGGNEKYEKMDAQRSAVGAEAMAF